MMRNASARSPISSIVSTEMLVSRSPRAMASAPACRFCSGRVMRPASRFDRKMASTSASNAPATSVVTARRRAMASGSRSTATPSRPTAAALTSWSCPKATEYSWPSTSSGMTTVAVPSREICKSGGSVGPTSRAPVAAVNVEVFGWRPT